MAGQITATLEKKDQSLKICTTICACQTRTVSYKICRNMGNLTYNKMKPLQLQ